MDKHVSFERLDKLRELLNEKGYKAIYLRDEPSIQWLCGFDGVMDGGGAFSLFVTQDVALLHTDSRYEVAVKRAAQDSAIEADFETISHAEAAAKGIFEELGYFIGSSNIAIEDSLSLREYRQLQNFLSKKDQLKDLNIIETSSFVGQLRAIKDASEIVRLRNAQKITDAAFTHIKEYVRPGMTEREVQLELEHFMCCAGAEGLAFSSIVATGANGACPHSIPGNTKLEAGQCVVLDFGAKKNSYCSDMTRMLFLGEPNSEMKSAYAALRSANETVEVALKPGVTGKEMHELAESVLASCGFGNMMGHGLGHGVGLEVHESPLLSPKYDKVLVPGNVVTVEPGIYKTGEFGMRLEDFGVLTETGFDVFTQSGHDMVII